MSEIVGFEKRPFSYNGKTKPVYWRGSGPGVLIMHEVPGITPEVADFARRVADAGFTAVMPHLFGTPNKPFSNSYAAGQIVRLCISREFTLLARQQSSAIADWLRALCRAIHQTCGGPGVGALGMCLTGGFALALMIDDSVMAPVLSQPSVPFPLSAAHRADLGITDDELSLVKQRVTQGCTVLGLRFTDDTMAPGDRFDTLRQTLGDGFEGIEIDSSAGNPHGIPTNAHSVLTNDFVDQAGHPTRAAYERVIAFFDERLRMAG